MTEDFDLDRVNFKLIKEMGKSEVIEEIIESFRGELNKKEFSELKETLVRIRVDTYKTRTLKEAGLKEQAGGFLGGIQYVEEGE